VPTPPSEPADFDWNKVLSHAKTNYIALFSVLSKCTPSMSGATLTLETGNGFYKTKLADSRYRGNIIEALRARGMGDVTIETVDAQAPPKDAVAASVAALMGGGEEYAIEEEEDSQE